VRWREFESLADRSTRKSRLQERGDGSGGCKADGGGWSLAGMGVSIIRYFSRRPGRRGSGDNLYSYEESKIGIEDPLWSISGGWFPDHTLLWLGDLVMVYKIILDRPYSRNGSLFTQDNSNHEGHEVHEAFFYNQLNRGIFSYSSLCTS